jgi:hypothetical protein
MQASYLFNPDLSLSTMSQLEPSFDRQFSSRREGIDGMLVEAVERGLRVFGESVAQVIFYNLYTRYSLSKPEIPSKPERFVEALSDMFGDGADTIEKLVVETVCTRFGLHPRLRRKFRFPECIREVKNIRRATEGKAEKAEQP